MVVVPRSCCFCRMQQVDRSPCSFRPSPGYAVRAREKRVRSLHTEEAGVIPALTRNRDAANFWWTSRDTRRDFWKAPRRGLRGAIARRAE